MVFSESSEARFDVLSARRPPPSVAPSVQSCLFATSLGSVVVLQVVEA
ncbi:MAG: hypothetical protein QXP98_00375 [Thermoproteus sp.]